MEGGGVVVAGSAEGEEVLDNGGCSLELWSERTWGEGEREGGKRGGAHLCRLGDALAENLNLDVAMRGM